MATPTTEEIATVQAQTRTINAQLKADPALHAKYAADPTGFLTAAGLPADAARSLVARIAQDKDGSEVSGYDYYDSYYSGYSASDRDSMEYGH